MFEGLFRWSRPRRVGREPANVWSLWIADAAPELNAAVCFDAAIHEGDVDRVARVSWDGVVNQIFVFLDPLYCVRNYRAVRSNSVGHEDQGLQLSEAVDVVGPPHV